MFCKYDTRTGELFNADRAKSAAVALENFCLIMFGGRTFEMLMQEEATEDGDARSAAGDLICNILHLANLNGWDAKEMMRASFACYEDELHIEATAGEVA
jgi:hypothetical protein